MVGAESIGAVCIVQVTGISDLLSVCPHAEEEDRSKWSPSAVT